MSAQYYDGANMVQRSPYASSYEQMKNIEKCSLCPELVQCSCDLGQRSNFDKMQYAYFREVNLENKNVQHGFGWNLS